MTIAYINQNIPIPNASVTNIRHNKVADGDYTALGNYREDNVSHSRTWVIESKYITKSQYDAIYSHLSSVNFGQTKFWLDEFSGTSSSNSIDAVINLTVDERTPFFQNDGTLQPQGRTIELEVIEVEGSG